MIIDGRYELGELLGTGGMGVVYKARNIHSGETVAIKQLHQGLANEQSIQRFEREGRVLRLLNHPNIVKVVDMVRTDDNYYLVVEYIDGGDLQHLIRSRELTIEEVLNIGLDIADALTRAHRLHIVHRDLKPANVLMTKDGVPRVADFGLSHAEDDADITDNNFVSGTAHYLAPEAINGDINSHTVDIWALGILLYQILTSQLPFRGTNMPAIMIAILEDPLPDIYQWREDIPAGVAQLIEQMLQKNPVERISSVRQVGMILEELLTNNTYQLMDSNAMFNFVHGTDDLDHWVQKERQHNLPAQSTFYVYRAEETEQLVAMVRNTESRLITVLASGGMGKTQLIIEVGYQVLTEFDNVILVTLAPDTTNQQLAIEIGNAIGLQLDTDSDSVTDQILDLLKPQTTLLLLDNGENLADSPDFLNQILKVSPLTNIVIGSRQRLNHREEKIFNLGGMTYPDSAESVDLLDYTATQLFILSAQRVQQNFTVDDIQTRRAICEICRLSQGMPLAIVLASSWLTLLRPDEIVAEMKKGIDILETDMQGIPERQRSIRAVFNHSWELLSDDEKAIFMKLAIMRNGFTREAAQAITNASLRVLMSLSNKSIIQRDDRTNRYYIAELLRQYTLSYLRESDEETTTRTQHSHYYLTMLANLEDDIKGKAQLDSLTSIDAELDNITMAFQWAAKQGDHDVIVNGLEAFFWYGMMRTRYEIIMSVFDEVESQFKTQIDANAVRLKAQVELRRWWMLRWRRGVFASNSSVMDRLTYLQTYFADNNQPRELATTLILRSDATLSIEQNPQQALQYLDESKSILDRLNDSFYLAWMLHFRARQVGIIEGVSNGIDLQAQALEVRRGRNDIVGTVYSLYNYAFDLMLMGEFQQSEVRATEMLNLSTKLREYSGVIMSETLLSTLAFFHGDFNNIRDMSNSSEKLARDLNHPLGLAYALLLKGLMSFHDGHTTEAHQLIRQAHDLSKQDFIQHMTHWAFALTDYQGQAKTHIQHALQFAVERRSPGAMAWCLPVCALLQAKQGNAEYAVSLIALAEHHMSGMRSWTTKWKPLVQLNQDLMKTLGEDDFLKAYERGLAMELLPTIQVLLEE